MAAALSRRGAARLADAVRPAHPGAAAAPGTVACAANLLALLDGCADQRVATATAARCRTPTRCAACRRSTAPAATRSRYAARVVDDRAERGHRQPARLRRRRGRGALRRQLPRRSRWRSRSTARDRAGRAGQHQRAAHRAAGEPDHERGLPPFLTEDGGLNSGFMIAARDRGGAGGREQGALPPGVGRLDPDRRPARRTTSRWGRPPPLKPAQVRHERRAGAGGRAALRRAGRWTSWRRFGPAPASARCTGRCAQTSPHLDDDRSLSPRSRRWRSRRDGSLVAVVERAFTTLA